MRINFDLFRSAYCAVEDMPYGENEGHKSKEMYGETYKSSYALVLKPIAALRKHKSTYNISPRTVCIFVAYLNMRTL